MFSNQLINWFEFCHFSRSFWVNIQSKRSGIAKIDCGVPQGSISGPLLFLLYINDMGHAVDCDLFQHVDDFCLIHLHNER